MSDLDGRTLEFSDGAFLESNRGVVATNGPVHDLMLEALRAVAQEFAREPDGSSVRRGSVCRSGRIFAPKRCGFVPDLVRLIAGGASTLGS